MKKKNTKETREITFYSPKCQSVLSVFGTPAKTLAEHLEKDDNVLKYSSKIPVKIDPSTISRLGIRPAYMKEEWISDFSVELIDGSVYIIEAITQGDLEKKSEIEKIELSRRYWKSKGIKWKIFIDTKSTGGSNK